MESVIILTNVIWALIFIVGAIILRYWLKSTIQYSVKHEYDVMLEEIKEAKEKSAEADSRQYEIRLKSALIAELMAEWVTPDHDKKKLRQLTNEAFLWLPSDLAKDLSNVLAHRPDAINYRTFMSRVRKYLLGDDDSLHENDFITFPLSQTETQKLPGR